MYKSEKIEDYIVIHNEKRKFRILEFREPNQIKIVDITYGNKTNGGYWTTINSYFDDFMSKVLFNELKRIR
ncbi:hypothetical protein NG774_10070 [Aliarcobacter cryaerophilus]|uniref:hypothetical protein n=1 Tax=Aliarcobacter cryaerophilus TaxID=28198 RepID=UPI003DA3C37C